MTDEMARGEIAAAPGSASEEAQQAGGFETIAGAPATFVADVGSYDVLHRALRARWHGRGYAIEHANEVIGLAARFLNKALGLNPERQITMTTLWPILSGFGLKLVLVDDPDAIEKFESRIKRRDETLVRLTQTHYTMTNRRWAQIAKMGRKARWEGKSKAERVAAARHAAHARWGRGNGGAT
jgi:hypothetical protein